VSFTIPNDAPFSGPQRMWLKGFLDGISSMLPQDGAPTGSATEVSKPGLPVTILWGSQTGSAESFAKKLSKALGSSGHSATVIDMANATVAQLASIENLLVITSTYGDGEPPDNALGFHGALHADDVPPLSNLHFAVFALGDSNYPEFCKCGHDFDKRLTALGATPLLSITESDVDHDQPFAEWSKKLETALTSRLAIH
jgi:sulfite reductase (NADPH) flavoprotein alpha-component